MWAWVGYAAFPLTYSRSVATKVSNIWFWSCEVVGNWRAGILTDLTSPHYKNCSQDFGKYINNGWKNVVSLGYGKLSWRCAPQNWNKHIFNQQSESSSLFNIYFLSIPSYLLLLSEELYMTSVELLRRICKMGCIFRLSGSYMKA